ncbi:MAG: DNA polymerase III subunit chi [Gammaproteobacteria bacterium]|nr:DNA polymerase III subunit chi [Gammaproteobacteria bacterium]
MSQAVDEKTAGSHDPANSHPQVPGTSTTRVDFYVLSDNPGRARLTLACRIAEKAFAQAHKVYVYAASAAEAGQLDELLWTFRDTSFVPHVLADARIAPDGDELPPVLIGHREAPGEMGTFLISSEIRNVPISLLINMSQDVPGFFDRFARVAELVDAGENHRRLGRERFRYYRDRGCTLETHRL